MTPSRETQQKRGMRAFTIVWFGQLISLLGSSMTGFALPIWVFGETQRVQELALVGLAFTLPLILLSPVVGALVDRYDRKLMMMASDLAAGLMTILVFFLVSTNQLEIWHLYVTSAVSGAFQTFQWPAYSAAISVMLPKKQYGRAHGMISLARSGSGIFAPLLAGALLAVIGLRGILLIDIVTFTFAVGTLLLVHIPQPPQTTAGASGQGSLLREAAFGFQYIFARPSLLGLQLVFLVGNFAAALAFTVLPAMILARSGQNELVFGTAQAMGAAGGVIGGLVMSAWGGPRRLVQGVLFGWIASGGAMVVLGMGRALPLWGLGLFLASFIVPILNGSNQAIWQAKVAPDVQGRVFSVRRLIAWFTTPLARLAAIPLADAILVPAMVEGGSLTSTFGWLVGIGPGAGMSLVFIFSGLALVVIGFVAYLVPRIRDVELLLPDHELVDEAAGDLEPALATT
ncbi:MAG: MFS transporter [Candidatus Promineifilaceae bacterium]|nr:MFS transporter [Candidatus Promineifilaceae bacterium]